MIRDSQNHHIHVFTIQDFLVYLGGEKVVAKNLFGSLEPAVIAVGNGNQLYTGNLKRGLGIFKTNDTGTNKADPDSVIWRNGFCRESSPSSQHIGCS